MWRKTQSILSTLLIIAGLLMPSVGTAMALTMDDVTISRSENANPNAGKGGDKGGEPSDTGTDTGGGGTGGGTETSNQTGTWRISSSWESGSNTITYTVYPSPAGSTPQAVSHVSIKVPSCLSFGSKDGSLVQAGLYTGPVVKAGGGSEEFTFDITWPGEWTEIASTTAWIKTGAKSGDSDTPQWITTSAKAPKCPTTDDGSGDNGSGDNGSGDNGSGDNGTGDNGTGNGGNTGGQPQTGGGTSTETISTGSITVRVFDNSPRNEGNLVPIVNADITLSNGLTATTDGTGQFTFAGLNYGLYGAEATSVDPVTGVEPQTGRGLATIDQANPNGVINILLSWTPALANPTTPPTTTETPPVAPPPPQAQVEKLGKITVRVYDGSARNNGQFVPINGASVNMAGRTGTTNTSGQIVFENLPFAQYTALVEAVDPQNPTAGESKSGSGMGEISPKFPEETITVILMWDPALAAPGSLASAAAVEVGSAAGRICAPRAPGADIVATDEAGRTVKTFIAATGRLGIWLDYTLENLAPGNWTITLNSPGDAPVQQTVTVKSGEPVAVADFSLACTGQNAAQFPIGIFYMAGTLMVAAGLGLRRFGKVAL